MKRLINSCDSGPCTATLPTASNKSNSSIESTGVHRFTLAGSECFQFRSVPHRRQSLNWKFIGTPRQTAPPLFFFFLFLRRECHILLSWLVTRRTRFECPAENFCSTSKRFFSTANCRLAANACCYVSCG